VYYSYSLGTPLKSKQTNPVPSPIGKTLPAQDFWTFLALELLTGIVKKPAIKDYWSTRAVFSTPIFSKAMSRTRFEQILRCVHFCDNNNQHTSDRLWKFGKFLPDILRNFRHSINPGEFICIDESLLSFKGRLAFKQYDPLKRARFRVKYYAIVDCESKFLVNLKIYLGKSTGEESRMIKEFGMGGATVISLLRKYLGKNHKVVVDNFFNSPKLQEYLIKKKTFCVGTVRPTGKEMPRFEKKKLRKGSVNVYTNGTLLVEQWEDRRQVNMLSSFIPHKMVESLSSNPRNSRMKPKSVMIYSANMDGVDHFDQKMAPYESLRKTVKWYKKFAFHLFDLATYNSHIPFKHYSTNPADPRLIYKNFILALIEDIIDKNRVQRIPVGRPVLVPRNVLSTVLLVQRSRSFIFRSRFSKPTESPANPIVISVTLRENASRLHSSVKIVQSDYV